MIKSRAFQFIIHPFTQFGLLALTFALMWIPNLAKPLTPVFFFFLLTSILTGIGLVSKWLKK